MVLLRSIQATLAVDETSTLSLAQVSSLELSVGEFCVSKRKIVDVLDFMVTRATPRTPIVL